MYKSEQLALSLKQLIQSGVWKPADKLPSLRQQAKVSGFSLMTVMHAYQALEAQGLIYAKEKFGYFVSNPATQQQAQTAVGCNERVTINSRVFRYLKSLQDPQIIPLGSAFPDSKLLHCNKLLNILSRQTKSKLVHEHTSNLPPGNLALRQLIAQRYAMQGIPTNPEDIVITSGALDALNLSLQAITQSGDYVLLQDTSFYGAWQAAERLGLKVITIATHPEHGLDLQAFENAVRQYPIKVCLLMLNSQNPIGYTVSDDIKAELARLLHQYQVYLIEDDVYEELYYGSKKPRAMKYFDAHHMVLHCSSFSKTLGAGFRVGWVYTGKFSELIQHAQLMSTLSVNSFIQNALVEYLAHRYYEKHLHALREKLQDLKQQYFHRLTHALPANFICHPAPSGYFLWIELPSYLNSEQVYQDLLHAQISVAPSSLFDVQGQQQHHLRLNCSFEIDDSMHQALNQLVAYLIDANQKHLLK